MLKRFENFISEKKLLEADGITLLTVSGGVDSVVMCELFYQSGLKFAIAHCNFKLRGKESDQDEDFVETLAEKYNVPFHSITFDTKRYANDKKYSIQEAARELRYGWFRDVAEQFGYVKIATAHHQDDAIETFFINLIRGTGIRGLSGIPLTNNNIIRPLMCFNRVDILRFVKENKLKYREDSSNSSDKYMRNNIRSRLMPLLKSMNTAAAANVFHTIEKLAGVERIYLSAVEKKKKKILKEGEGRISIPIKSLKKLDAQDVFLFELLYPLGFNHQQVESILKSLDHVSGKNFYSDSHHLLKDRAYLIVRERSQEERPEFLLKKKDILLRYGSHSISAKIIASPSKVKLSPSKHIAQFDYGKLVFPLSIRKWEKGDVFQPIGMKGKKKISDFLIDNKISLIDKEDIWVMVSAGIIVWVIGHRIDDRFKVTENTRKIYFAELMK